MSKKKTEVTTVSKKTLDLISSDINIGIDEVVSVYVTKYETSLFEKKDALGKSIKEVKQQLVQLDKSLVDSITISEYQMQNDDFGIKVEVEEDGVDINWNPKKLHISVSVRVSDTEDSGRYGADGFHKNYHVDISKTDVNQYNFLTEEVENLTTELTETMLMLKQVSRKERQIRGKISELKLEQSGLKELLDSKEMLQLVKIDD